MTIDNFVHTGQFTSSDLKKYTAHYKTVNRESIFWFEERISNMDLSKDLKTKNLKQNFVIYYCSYFLLLHSFILLHS